MSPRRSKTWILSVLGVVVSLVLLHHAYWLYLIREANTALQQDRQVAVASDRYQKAVDWTPPFVSRMPGVREPLRHVLIKQAQIFHLQQKRDQALGFLQGVRSQYPFLERDWEYHLWYGNALFFRAIFQDDPQVLVNDLQAASRAYQTALELNPASWDARFNYEFIKRALLAEGEQGQQQLKLLLEERQRNRRDDELPPDKIG